MSASFRHRHRTSTGRTPTVAVVGAGPGGLAAALLLAASGVRTVVVEQSPGVGGRTRTLTTPEGFRFDLGATFFLYPQILAEIFQACGERLDDHVDLKRLDPLYRLIFEGAGELEIVADPVKLAAAIAKLAPDDAPNLDGFLAENRAKLASFGPVLQQPFHRRLGFLAPGLLKALPRLGPFSSVDEALRRHFADPRIRLAFSFQTKYLGMSPFRCPSLFTILSFLEHEHGVFHPMGGCGAVSDAMARVAAKLGVEFRLNTPVRKVTFTNGKAVGVETDDGPVDADAVVLNGDFAHSIRQLVPEEHRRRWADAKVEAARLSCSTFMLYLGLDGSLPELGHHTILLAKDYERNLIEIERGVLPDEPSIYLQNAGVTDPGMAPPGRSSLYILVPVPNLKAPIDWAVTAKDYRARVLARLKLLGLPDVERRIRYERMVTPQDWQDTMAVGRGATFNLQHDLLQMLWWRPHNRFGPGLYLVGGGTHPGSGLPVIFEGARISVRLLLDELGLKDASRQVPDSLADGSAATALGAAA